MFAHVHWRAALLKPFPAGFSFRQHVHESRSPGTVMTYMLDVSFCRACLRVSIRFATLINFNGLMTSTHIIVIRHLYWSQWTVMDFNCVMQRRLLCVLQCPAMCNDDHLQFKYVHKKPNNIWIVSISIWITCQESVLCNIVFNSSNPSIVNMNIALINGSARSKNEPSCLGAELWSVTHLCS